MSRKEVGTGWDRDSRNAINNNFEELYKVQDRAIAEATQAVISDSKLIWKEPVATFNDIATTYTDPQNGYTVMARDTGKVYRFFEGNWDEIQEIDAGPVNAAETRLYQKIDDTAGDLSLLQTQNKTNIVESINEVTSQMASSANEIQEKYESPFVSQGIKIPKPILVFEDDDGRIETWTKTREIFNRKGKKFVSAVSAGLVDTTGYMTLSQVKQLQAEGHEISAHSFMHYGGDADIGGISQSKQWFIDNDIKCDTYTWVGGAYSDLTINEAKKYYKCAVSVERGINIVPVKQFRLNRFAVGSMFGNNTIAGLLEDGSQTQYNAMVDMAKNNNALVIAMMHNWNPQFDTTQEARLEAMIDYADNQGVEIMTLSEALEYFGNLIDVGTDSKDFFRVGANGKISSPVLDKFIYKNMGLNPSGITSSTLGTSFEKGFVSIATFNLTPVTGFPVSNAGILETYYPYDAYGIHQKWYPYNSGTMWFRQYNGANNTWGIWRRISLDSTSTISVSVDAQTINANSVKEIQITHPDASNIDGNNDLILMSPIGGLENNLIHSVSMWSNKTIILRLYNPTASAITTAVRNWRVKVLK
ncbi:hypothetical protein [Niallia sp. Krafla_26]|uniref:hypothetical protein n=1 Tax=Niallia sp. Krafla_26 TaxID=3064703 RepID=UPI003D16D3DD